MIVGLCSTYREGRLAFSAIRSLLEACDSVIVAEGPIGDAPTVGEETDYRSLGSRVTVLRGQWASDAEKRTALLARAQRIPNLKWGVILDGDELLVDGRFLPEYFDALHPDALGFSLHLMELDGSCSYIPNRVLRLDRIKRWVISSYAFELDTGVLVQRGNLPILKAGEQERSPVIPKASVPPGHVRTEEDWERNPDAWVDTGDGLRQRRRPLAGEPHILHRSVLRSPDRARLQRQSDAEAEAVAGIAALRKSL